jgi:type II secretory pathway pseudopilin PulG
MFKKIKSRRGETIIEVFVAVIVLVVGVLAATRLFALATITNQLSKERVIATSLAREGIEAVRVIRDTNWLRFAGDRRLCWNSLDQNSCNGLPGSAIMHQQNYIAYFDPANYRWELVDALTSPVRLDLTDGITVDDEQYHLNINDASGLYNHDLFNAVTNPNSVFYREIYTEYLNDDQTQDGSTNESANIIRVTSKVAWYDRGKLNDVTLTTILTDYLGRKDHL